MNLTLIVLLWLVAAGLFVLAVIGLRMLLYRWAEQGFLFGFARTASGVPVEVAHNLRKMVVATTDEEMYEYYLALKDGLGGSQYRILPPGASGIFFLGIPFIATIPEWADSRDIFETTTERHRSFSLRVEEMTFDFEPAERELQDIRKAVAEARKESKQGLSPDVVRKLLFTPDLPTRDLIVIKSRIKVYYVIVDPLRRFRNAQFVWDLVRGKVVELYSETLNAQTFMTEGAETKSVATLTENFLTNLRQQFRTRLGLPETGRLSWKFREDGTVDVGYVPDSTKFVAQALQEWGGLIIDAVVEDVQEKDGSITNALAGIKKAVAAKMEQITRAQGAKEARTLAGQGEENYLKAVGAGEKARVEANLAAFAGQNGEVTDHVRDAYVQSVGWQATMGAVDKGDAVVVASPRNLSEGLAMAGAAFARRAGSQPSSGKAAKKDKEMPSDAGETPTEPGSGEPKETP